MISVAAILVMLSIFKAVSAYPSPSASTINILEVLLAYFMRAPDAAGLKYWVEESGLSIEKISKSFFDQEETLKKYPESMDTATFINTIYNNVFGRDADAKGAVYWAEQLSSGAVARADMIMAVVNGAIDTETTKDATMLKNKTAVGVHFAESGLNDTTQAKDVMSSVDATEDSVTQANAKVDTYVDETFKYKLTTQVDNIEGSAQDELIKGVISGTVSKATFSDGDKIDGKEGNDTLSFSIINGSPATAVTGLANVQTTLSNVENVEFRSDLGGSVIDTENWVGVEKFTFNKETTNSTLNNVGSSFKSIELNGRTAAGTTTINLADGLDDSTVAVKIASSSVVNSVDISGGAVEHFKVTSSGNSTGAGFTTATQTSNDRNLADITIDGNSDLIVDSTTGATKLSKIDASALKAAIEIKDNSTLAKLSNDLEILGGTGDDKIYLGNGDNKVTAGDGNDTIKKNSNVNNTTFGDGDNIVDAGAGDDTIDLGGGDNTVNAGDGKDRIVLGDGDNKVTTSSGDGYIELGNGNNTIVTGDGNYNLAQATIGTANYKGITVGNGTNSITTGAGKDDITTGTGKNTVVTNAGDDKVSFGGSGSLDTGAGSDTITGDFGGTSSSNRVTLNAGAGDDNITVSGGYVEISEASGTDILNVNDNTTNNDPSSENNNTNVLLKAGTYSSINVNINGTLDASSMTSNLTATVDGGTLKTGSGADTVTFGTGGGTVDAGTGADVIIAYNDGNADNNAGGDDIIDYTKFDKSSNVLSGTTLATADKISNFGVEGSDQLKMGTSSTDDNAIHPDNANAKIDTTGDSSVTFDSALAAANDQMNGDVIYYADNNGTDTYFFYDADSDGTADMGVVLLGLHTDTDNNGVATGGLTFDNITL